MLKNKISHLTESKDSEKLYRSSKEIGEGMKYRVL